MKNHRSHCFVPSLFSPLLSIRPLSLCLKPRFPSLRRPTPLSPPIPTCLATTPTPPPDDDPSSSPTIPADADIIDVESSSSSSEPDVAAVVNPPRGRAGEPMMAVAFTCKCGERVKKEFSKQSYEKGVVLIKCWSCDANHLIADNLGYFDHLTDDGGTNIEKIAGVFGLGIEKVASKEEFEEKNSKWASGQGFGRKEK